MIAWIAYRDESRIDDLRTRPTLEVIVEAAESGHLSVTLDDGTPDLSLVTAPLEEALAAGLVAASAIYGRKRNRRQIPAEAWAERDPLTLCFEEDPPFACLYSRRYHDNSESAPWKDPWFSRAEVCKVWPPHAARDKPQSRSIRTHGAERAERSRDRGLDALGQLLAQTYHNLYRQLGTRPSYKAVLNALPDEDSMGDDADRVLRDVGVDPQHELVLWYDHEGQERETTFKQIRERLTTVHRRHRA